MLPFRTMLNCSLGWECGSDLVPAGIVISPKMIRSPSTQEPLAVLYDPRAVGGAVCLAREAVFHIARAVVVLHTLIPSSFAAGVRKSD